jgi:hypothetical protein
MSPREVFLEAEARGLRFGLWVIVACAVASCNSPRAPQMSEAMFPIVPALPPDYEPADLYADSTMVPVEGGVRLSRAYIAVSFKPEALQGERQEAISSVGGTVVGGALLGGGGGYYFVQVPHGATLADVNVAIGKLRDLTGVESAIHVALAPVR